MNSVQNEGGLLYGMLVWFEGVCYDHGDDETGNNICDVNDDDDDDDGDSDGDNVPMMIMTISRKSLFLQVEMFKSRPTQL